MQEERRQLEIAALYPRHPGVPTQTAAYFAMVAGICMSRHHESPHTWEVSSDGRGDAELFDVTWPTPTSDEIRGNANEPEATRDGAYCLALAAADPYLGLVAYRRAEAQSGADYYMIPAGALVQDDPELDFERDDLVMLEISGIDRDTDGNMRTRVRVKVEHVVHGGYPWPGYAGIVGFATARVWFRKARG